MDILQTLQGIGKFAAYFAASLVALGVFLGVYMAITPHREWALIRNSNSAAAISLGGAAIGFTLPLASAVVFSVSLPDMALWAGVSLVVQLIVFFAVNMALRGLSSRIEQGDQAAGITLAAASVAIGILNAASLSY